MKRIVIFFCLVISGYSSYSQLFKIAGHDVGFAYVGPKVGMTFSKISNWTTFGDVKNRSRVGSQFGVIGELGFTDRFSIDGELLFVSKGHRQTFDGGQSKVKVSYIGIPLLAKYSFKMLGLSKVYAKGGAFTNVRTGGSFQMELDGQPTFEEDLNADGWRRIDVGLSLGAGAEYEADYGIWGVDLRYDQSFFDAHVSDQSKNRNRTFGVSVIYKYNAVDLFLRLRKKKLNSK
jgi:hypothetical protein